MPADRQDAYPPLFMRHGGTEDGYFRCYGAEADSGSSLRP